MSKWRKKPIVIEAEQITGETTMGDVARLGVLWDEYGDKCGRRGLYIETLEGPHLVSDGDWIITGIKGEKYPCKPDIFALTYEPVEEGAS